MKLACNGLYNNYTGQVSERLTELRSMILDVAKTTPGVGQIEECLKWGQPSFVTTKPASGSTIRIDAVKDEPHHVAMYFICSTTLVDDFREIYPDTFDYRGNRALVFDANRPFPEEELRHCIAKALTYKLKR
ncbi:MAG: DUF1801 domain-containing protein [Rhizobiaceae bacterium]|nr:DUF1801 domain-containing protein [Rhizobiaceae bacterium]